MRLFGINQLPKVEHHLLLSAVTRCVANLRASDDCCGNMPRLACCTKLSNLMLTTTLHP